MQRQVRDDGIGGANPARGCGLIGWTDCVEALGETIDVDSPAGEGDSTVCLACSHSRLAAFRAPRRRARRECR